MCLSMSECLKAPLKSSLIDESGLRIYFYYVGTGSFDLIGVMDGLVEKIIIYFYVGNVLFTKRTQLIR